MAKNKYSKEALYQDYKNHFVGMGRMTKTQFEQWYYETWKSKNNKNQSVKLKSHKK
jgi:hypothetical protein